jgi:hypothetical protein
LENLCRGHNARKDPRGPQFNPKFNGANRLKQLRESGVQRGKPYEMIKGEEAEKFFRAFAVKLLNEVGETEVEELIDAAKDRFFKDTGGTISQKALFSYYKSMRNRHTGVLEEFTKGEDQWVRIRQ